jgi:Holliday junction resolvasome RuvABC endonuclease subunit
MKKVLGIDISSSCIGYCVLEVDGSDIKYVSMNYLKPIKAGTIMERVVDTRDKLLNIIDAIKPDYIGIEDLIKYMPKSTATTVVVLATFNRMVCLLAHDYLGKQPELFNVLTIRHGIKLNKICPKKEDVPQLVAKHLGITFPYEYNKKNKEIVENYDKADGTAVALYYAMLLTGKIKPKKLKTK